MIRTAGGFPSAEFALNVCKSVRKGHVQTREPWTRNCKQLVYAAADESIPELPAIPELALVGAGPQVLKFR